MVTAIAIARISVLFTVVMLYGIYSILTASLFVALDALDVAFTEAAVGTCISTILMLSALFLTATKREEVPKKISPLPIVITLAVGAALIFGLTDMPIFGDPNAPPNLHVVPRYLIDSAHEVGIPNVVTSVLASYRGYDTLGEVVVVFTAGIGVIALLGQHVRRRRKGE